MNVDNNEVTWMLGVAREAGNLALSYFGHTTGTLKPDSSWVTEADLAVEAFVREAIQSAHPDDTIIGEETPIDPVDPSRRVWAIDPIDGTRAFNHGFPVWGVSIGLLEDGKPEAGAIVLPALNDLYHADGKNAFLNGALLRLPTASIDTNAVLLVSEDAYRAQSITYPGTLLSLGSAAAHLCYVARGAAVGAMDQACLWDYAAAAAILQSVGIAGRYVSGTPIDFPDLYDGSVVSEPTLFAPDAVFATLRQPSD